MFCPGRLSYAEVTGALIIRRLASLLLARPTIGEFAGLGRGRGYRTDP